MNEVRRGSVENPANFMASFVKGHLKGVHVARLMDICKLHFRTISKNGKQDCCDDSLP